MLSEQPAGYSDTDEISWTGEEHAVFEYRLDDGEWIRAAGPLDLSGLPDGAHIFEVRQTDEAGNVSEVALRKWTRDTVTPDAPVLSDRPLGHSAANDISWTGEEHAVFEYQLDSGEWTTGVGPLDLSDLADGEHTIAVRQTDEAGHTSPAAIRTWIRDTTAADAPTIVERPAAYATTTSFTWTGEEDATFECQVDGGEWVACASPFAPDLADGEHTLRIRQTDPSGNVSTTAEYAWVLDTAAPEAPVVVSGPTGTTDAPNVRFEWTAEPGAVVECRLDGGPWVPCPSPLALHALGLGAHALELRATDAAGNLSAIATARWTLVKHTDPPIGNTPGTIGNTPGSTGNTPGSTGNTPGSTGNTPGTTGNTPGTIALEASLSRQVSMQGDQATVGCLLTGTKITGCRVQVYVKASALGRRTATSRKVPIGTGHTRVAATTRRIAVRIRLNRTGRRYVDRLGGVPATFRVLATDRDGRHVRAVKRARHRPHRPVGRAQRRALRQRFGLARLGRPPVPERDRGHAEWREDRPLRRAYGRHRPGRH